MNFLLNYDIHVLFLEGAIRLQTLLLITSIVFIIAQAVFQIVLVSYGPYGHFIELCKFN